METALRMHSMTRIRFLFQHSSISVVSRYRIRRRKGYRQSIWVPISIFHPVQWKRGYRGRSIWARHLAKKIATFKPELILISAGFDSRANDPLGQFKLGDDDFFDLTKMLIGEAKKFCNGHLLSILEGGYNLND